MASPANPFDGITENTDFYKLLDIERDATEEDIDAALLDTLDRYKDHPDYDGLCAQIRLAHTVLSNPDTKKEYDDVHKENTANSPIVPNYAIEQELSQAANDDHITCEICQVNPCECGLPCDMCQFCDGCKLEHIHKTYRFGECQCIFKDNDEGLEEPIPILDIDVYGEREMEGEGDGKVEVDGDGDGDGNNEDEDGEEDEENVDIVENNRYPLTFTAVGTHSGTRDSPFSVSSTESPIPVDIEPLAYPSDDGEEMEV